MKYQQKTLKNLFHDAVKRGLEKDHWQITNDLLELEWEEVKVKIDLAAERLIAAEQDQQKIAVEIKSRHQIKIIVYEPIAEEIIKWIN